jgi:hypothetical protein
MWYHLIRAHNNLLCCVIYYTISGYIISHYTIILHHVVHITWQYMASYPVLSYHTLSYYIILYHIIMLYQLFSYMSIYIYIFYIMYMNYDSVAQNGHQQTCSLPMCWRQTPRAQGPKQPMVRPMCVKKQDGLWSSI